MNFNNQLKIFLSRKNCIQDVQLQRLHLTKLLDQVQRVLMRSPVNHLPQTEV